MTKKHFKLIASVISSIPQGKQYVADAFADELASKFPRFDRERFMKACLGPHYVGHGK